MSSTATTWPLPVKPAFHAAFAPTSEVLVVRSARCLSSRCTAVTPGVARSWRSASSEASSAT